MQPFIFFRSTIGYIHANGVATRDRRRGQWTNSLIPTKSKAKDVLMLVRSNGRKAKAGNSSAQQGLKYNHGRLRPILVLMLVNVTEGPDRMNSLKDVKEESTVLHLIKWENNNAVIPLK
jgi:hypothetical protein